LTAAQNQVLAASAALHQHQAVRHQAPLIPGTHALPSLADSLPSSSGGQQPHMYLTSATIPATFQGLF
jgi:hypothetical protein